LLIPVQAVILNMPLGGQVWWLGGNFLVHSRFEAADVQKEKTTRMTVSRTEVFLVRARERRQNASGLFGWKSRTAYRQDVGF
jgi:hypothetical protein